jgi:hypothetical protein
MDELIFIIKKESHEEFLYIIKKEPHEEFLNRIFAIANADYIENERWLLLKIKQLIKMRLKGLD